MEALKIGGLLMDPRKYRKLAVYLQPVRQLKLRQCLDCFATLTHLLHG